MTAGSAVVSATSGQADEPPPALDVEHEVERRQAATLDEPPALDEALAREDAVAAVAGDAGEEDWPFAFVNWCPRKR